MALKPCLRCRRLTRADGYCERCGRTAAGGYTNEPSNERREHHVRQAAHDLRLEPHRLR
jgi:hypothetical protein